MNFEHELNQSIEFLKSDAANKMLRIDPYWPKWNSPWWHMLLLHEMGETQKIPESVVTQYIDSLSRVPLKTFPLNLNELLAYFDVHRAIPCHCQLGNVYQVLAARGVDVDEELPWIRPWFLRYQMADGGFNCDNEAYLVKNEVPSSMVGTIAAFEAILLYTPRKWTSEEEKFIDLGAKFLMERKLMNGSPTEHNAEEREEAKEWMKLCFPRFYFYDVLRGLNALTQWSVKRDQKIPDAVIREVVTQLNRKFPRGEIKNERLSFEGVGTLSESSSGQWIRQPTATSFPLLEKVSRVGEPSPFLSREWEEIKKKMNRQNLDAVSIKK